MARRLVVHALERCLEMDHAREHRHEPDSLNRAAFGATWHCLTGCAIGEAARIALAAGTVSIAVMEVVDNSFVLLVPGAMEAGLGDFLFWWSLGVRLFIAFWAAFPVNRALIAGGRGPRRHARVPLGPRSVLRGVSMLR
jgi:hypothetical protein